MPELVLILSREEIAARVAQLADEIRADYNDEAPILIGVLKSSFVFLADLMRVLALPVLVDFVGLSSYGLGRTSGGVVTVTYPVRAEIAGRDVLVVEDIVDSGATIRFLRDYLAQRGAASVKLCALLVREAEAAPPVDYIGFAVGAGWLVGYGLDSGERYRHLPDIYVLEGEKDEKQAHRGGSGR